MVDRDIANALTIATIANVIEAGVIFFITSFSFIGESIHVPRHSRKRRIDQELVMKSAAADFSGRLERSMEVVATAWRFQNGQDQPAGMNSITERCYNPHRKEQFLVTPRMEGLVWRSPRHMELPNSPYGLEPRRPGRAE